MPNGAANDNQSKRSVTSPALRALTAGGLIAFALALLSPAAAQNDAGGAPAAEEPASAPTPAPTKLDAAQDEKSSAGTQDTTPRETPSDKSPESTESNAQPTLDELLGIEGESESAEEALPSIAPELEGNGAAAAHSISEVFLDAVASMRGSAERLQAMSDAGIATQRLQEDAIKKLDMLIAMAERTPQQKQDPQSQNQQSNSQPQPQQKQQSQPSSGENADQDSRPPFKQAQLDGEIDETRVEWGQLPDRVRDMLMQGSQDRSSILYRRLTERYYQRLAEESRQ